MQITKNNNSNKLSNNLKRTIVK